MTDTCATCAYFVPGDPPQDDRHTQTGDCRKYAPEIITSSPNTFPIVLATWWCQEFSTALLIGTCANCSAWSPVPNSPYLDLPPTPLNGECRRHAPKANNVYKSSPTIFPIVSFDQSCGEFVGLQAASAFNIYVDNAHTVGTQNALVRSIVVPQNSVFTLDYLYACNLDDMSGASSGFGYCTFYRGTGDVIKPAAVSKADIGGISVTTDAVADTGTEALEVWAESTLGGSVPASWYFRTQIFRSGR